MSTVKKDDKNLKPAPCGHVHYLRREILEVMGVDLTEHDALKSAGEEPGMLSLADVWPLNKEFTDGIYADAEAVIDAHADVNQFIERLDDHTRTVVLMRMAERMREGDPQLYRMIRLLALDALLTDINEEARKQEVAKAIGSLFGGMGLPVPGEEPPSGKKH